MCHLTTPGGDVKPRFWGQGKSGKTLLRWGDPTGIARPVEIPVFASLGEEPGERSCPSQKGTRAQALPSCAAHSTGVAPRLLPKTQPRSRAPGQDEWFYKNLH